MDGEVAIGGEGAAPGPLRRPAARARHPRAGSRRHLLTREGEVELARRMESGAAEILAVLARAGLRIPGLRRAASVAARGDVLGLPPPARPEPPANEERFRRLVDRDGALQRRQVALCERLPADGAARGRALEKLGHLAELRIRLLAEMALPRRFVVGVAESLVRAVRAAAPRGRREGAADRATRRREREELEATYGRPYVAVLAASREVREPARRVAEACSELVESNLGLVVSVARRYLGLGVPLEDLLQEGSIALITAADRYDHRLGHRFATYAIWWIRQAVGKAVADQSRTVRVPVNVHVLMGKVARTESQLVGRLHRPATLEEVARTSGVPLSRVRNASEARRRVMSLHVPAARDLQRDLIDSLAAEARSDASTCESELHDHMQRLLDYLPQRDRWVVCQRFGIGESEPRTLQQIAEVLGVSRERVRQIEVASLRRLRSAPMARSARDLLGP